MRWSASLRSSLPIAIIQHVAQLELQGEHHAVHQLSHPARFGKMWCLNCYLHSRPAAYLEITGSGTAVPQSRRTLQRYALTLLSSPALCLDVLKPLQVQNQTLGRLLDEHPLLRLLQRAAVVAVELVVTVQHLHRTAKQIKSQGQICLHTHEQQCLP